MQNPFAGRFFAQLGAGLAGGIALAYYFENLLPNIAWLYAALFALAVACALFKKLELTRLFAVMLIGAFLLCSQVDHMERQPPVDEYGVIEGRFNSYSERSQSGAVHLLLSDCTFNGIPLAYKVDVLTASAPLTLQSGNTVTANGTLLTPARRPSNPFQADPRVYNYSNDIGYKLNTLRVEHDDDTNIYTRIFAIRSNMEYALYNSVSEDEFALLRGMLFGDTTEIRRDDLEAFRMSGIAHLLAVSGLHVGIIIGALSWLLGLIRIKRWWRLVICSVAMLMYCALSGFSQSVMRASVMMVVLLLGGCIGERSDPLNSLGFSATLMLAINPISLFSASFLLSYSAVLGIICFSRRLAFILPKRKAAAFFVDSAKITVCAQGGVIPAQMALFGTISPLSFLTNLLTAPFVAAALILALFSSIIGCFYMPAAQIVAKLASAALFPIIASASAVSRLPLAEVITGSPGLAGMLSMYALLFALSKYAKSAKAQAYILSASAALGAVALATLLTVPTTLTFLDTGSSTTAVLRTQALTVLIGCGESTETYSAAEAVVLPYLRKSGYGRVDMAVMQLESKYAYDSFAQLMARYRVDSLFMTKSMMANTKNKTVGAKRTQIIEVEQGDRLYAQNAQILAIEDVEDVTYKLTCGDLCVMLSAIAGEHEADFVTQNLRESLKSDILKLGAYWEPHYADNFIAAANPQVIVASRTSGRLERKVDIFDIDRRGAVAIDLDDAQISALND